MSGPDAAAPEARRERLETGVLLALGAGELATGAALVAAPRLALALLGLPAPADAAIVFLRWIGVFVAAVGLVYGLGATGAAGAERGVRRRAALEWTSAARLLVAAFVAVAVLAGELAAGWCLVGGYDAAVALAQIAFLARGGSSREG